MGDDLRGQVTGSMKKAQVPVPVIGIIFGVLLYFSGIVQAHIELLLVTIISFIVSDGLCDLFIRGGGGILQIPIFGTKAQPKGYGFLMFFISIPISAVLVEWATQMTYGAISPMFRDLSWCIIIGLGLAVVVYLDMNAKFYER